VTVTDAERRAQSIRVAQEKVASLPDSHRQALEAEFLRAESEARDIMNHGKH
jgi:hypothetical protein